MKIWLLEEGKRTGPFESYKVRERITSGELKAETLSWYEGAPEWIPLSEIPSLSSAFPRPVSPPSLPDEVVNQTQVPEMMGEPAQLHLVQRFFARMIDVALYFFLVFIFKLQQGLNPFEPDTEHIYRELNYLWPFVFVDAFMIYAWGTTIGKKILSVNLTTATGGKLGFMESLIRSLRVWIVGLGMFIIFLPISLLITWLLSRKLGKLIWDLPKQYRVTVKPLTPMRIVIAIVVVIAGSSIVGLFIPEKMRQEQSERFHR